MKAGGIAAALVLLLACQPGGPASDDSDLEALLAQSEAIAAADPSGSEALAGTALENATARGVPALEGRALNRRGVARYYLGAFEAAYGDYQAALRIAESLEDRELTANALNSIGVLYYLWGNLELALDYYQRALSLRDPERDRLAIARASNNLGAAADAAGRHAEAVDAFHRSADLYERLGEYAFAISARNNLALSLLHLDRFEEAAAVLDQAHAQALRHQDRSGEATASDHRGLVLRERGQPAAARAAFERALELRRHIGDLPGTVATLDHLAAATADLGDLDGAVQHLEAAVALANELRVPQLERDAWQRRADIEERRGRPAAALAAWRRYQEVHARLLGDESARRLAEARAHLEVARQDSEIERLNHERRRSRTLLAGLSVATLLLAGLLLLLWRHTRLVLRARAEIEAKTKALELAHAELERSSRTELAHLARVVTLGELTAAVAHELNQPLAAIQTNAEVTAALLRRGDTAGDVEAAVADIALGAKRAWEVLDHLRRLARRGEIEAGAVELEALAREAIDIAATEARLRATDLRLEVDGPGPTVPGERVHLLQVVLNLISNAMAASEHIAELRVVEVRVCRHEHSGRIEVADRGPEIDQQVLDRMFEPFFTTRPSGLGMGLAISRRLIDAHGGRLWAHPRDGGGLVVGFDLPLETKSGEIPS